MKIELNGEVVECPDAATLADLVKRHGSRDTVAAINEAFVPRSQYGERVLRAGDRVELLAPMEGG